MSFKRPDLPVEADTTLDGAGTYTGEWVDSSSILSARIAFALYGSGSVGIEESVDGVNPLGFADLPLAPMSTLSNNAVFNPATRYFRVKVTGGSANAVFRVSIRRIA
jgi:hypothetical protein